MNKANYVRRNMRPNGSHTCHWPGCPRRVAPALWGCTTHWNLLPQDLRNAIWRTYRPGQEKDKSPSLLYVQVARRVQKWIKDHYPAVRGTPL